MLYHASKLELRARREVARRRLGYPDFLVTSDIVELVLFRKGMDMAHVSAVPQSKYGLNIIDI
ncbi:MAG: hypothetical protein ACI9D0_000506 [Bacteroidia bacterium]